MDKSRKVLADQLLTVSIVLLTALALVYVILLLVDRQISAGVTYKDVDLAAWIQAVGSVFAILASYVLSSRQARADRRLEDYRRANEDIRRLEAIDSALKFLQQQIERVHLRFDVSVTPVRNGFLLDAIRATKQIDLFVCPSPKARENLSVLLPLLDDLVECIDAYNLSFDSLHDDDGRSTRNLKNVLAVVRRGMTDAREAVAATMAELSSY